MNTQKSTKYIKIETNVIAWLNELQYPVYIASDEKNEMHMMIDSGMMITESLRPKIQQIRNLYIDARFENLYKDDHTNYLDSKNITNGAKVQKEIHLIYNKMEKLLDTLFTNDQININKKIIEESVNSMIDTILSTQGVLNSLFVLTANNYKIHTHSINTAIYAICLGERMKLQEDDLKALAIAALLHDLGKSKIDPQLDNKSDKLSLNEIKILQSHPRLGYEIALKMGITDKKILNGIMDHHEREDGSGYPRKKSANQISIIAKIVAVCETFDTITTERSHTKKLSTFEALKIMKTEMKQTLNERVINNLIYLFKQK